MLTLIAALDNNNLIGSHNKLPWPHLKADMKHFKEVTMGHPVIMGRKTFESIGKPLPGRRNIILSRSEYDWPGVTACPNLDEALNLIGDADAFVIGGQQIYELFLDVADRLLITRVHDSFEGDAHFPTITSSWKLQDTRDLGGESEIPLSIETYVRV